MKTESLLSEMIQVTWRLSKELQGAPLNDAQDNFTKTLKGRVAQSRIP